MRFETTIPPKVTKISGRKFSKSSLVKGVIIVSILLIKVSWCTLDVVSVNTTTDSSLAKASIIFSLIAFGSFTPTKIIFLVELFQIVAHPETSSIEIT